MKQLKIFRPLLNSRSSLFLSAYWWRIINHLKITFFFTQHFKLLIFFCLFVCKIKIVSSNQSLNSISYINTLSQSHLLQHISCVPFEFSRESDGIWFRSWKLKLRFFLLSHSHCFSLVSGTPALCTFLSFFFCFVFNIMLLSDDLEKLWLYRDL